MKPLRLCLVSSVLFGLCAGEPVFAESACDRGCLRDLLADYLRAVIAHDPASAPLAASYRHTENDVVQPLGEGMWRTATALGAVQRQYLDEVTGNAVYYGIVEESGVRAIVSARIRVEDRRITEGEWFIGRKADPGIEGVLGTVAWDADRLTSGNPPDPKWRNHFSDIFYIDGGLLRGIYTAMYYVPPDRAAPNWPPYDGNFPLAAEPLSTE